MKVTIDAGLCTGCSLCVTDLPEVFEMGDDGLAVVKVSSPGPDLAPKAKDTAATCPAAAILIEE
ncbi:ferredoxin [candidate division FCPU426 bacterium]|nr:ferredoxin [candidate division FCPU426 bacterium]